MANRLLASIYYANNDFWDVPAPNYATLLGTVGGGAGTNSRDTTNTVLQTAQRSPIAPVLFKVAGDIGHIYGVTLRLSTPRTSLTRLRSMTIPSSCSETT